MRIGIVTQWYPPEKASIPQTWATELARLGHEVHVITGYPNYPQGKVFPGYKVHMYEKETNGGVTVHRGPLYPSHDKSAIKRALNYSSFAAGSLITSLRVPKVDVWLTNCTPVFVATCAMVQSAIRKTPTVTIIQDLWPDSLVESQMMPDRYRSVAMKTLNWFCNAAYKSSDIVGVISPGMAGVLKGRGVPTAKLRYLPNAVPDILSVSERQTRPEPRSELGIPTGRIFMYAGNFGPLQNLEALVDAFRKVPAAQLVLVGSGVSEERIKECAGGAQNIHIIGRVAPDRIGQYLAASDVQVVSLADSRLLRATMPSKVQVSLAAGKPILAHAMGDAAKIVTEEGVGWHANPTDIEHAVETIRTIVNLDNNSLTLRGERARRLYETRYAPHIISAQLEMALLEAVGSINPVA